MPCTLCIVQRCALAHSPQTTREVLALHSTLGRKVDGPHAAPCTAWCLACGSRVPPAKAGSGLRCTRTIVYYPIISPSPKPRFHLFSPLYRYARMGGAESVSEGPPDACRWREGVGVGVGHIYPQGTMPGARRSHLRFLDTNRGNVVFGLAPQKCGYSKNHGPGWGCVWHS